MKKLGLLYCSLLCVYVLAAQQDWRLQFAQNDWYKKHGSKALQIGDTMPDIPLGKVLNNYTGKTKFSDFRGKLLILDFWNTYCPSCIALFPHMEQLQQEFGDQLQIILVNTDETEEQIRERQKVAKFHLPHLPSIVADPAFTNPALANSGDDAAYWQAPLNQLFPRMANPYHVWIDAKGIIRVRGAAENTYSKKIRDVLDGKEVYVMNHSANLPNIRAFPSYKLLGNFKTTPLIYGSFITPYNNEIYKGCIPEVIDSAANTRIIRFLNQGLLDLYLSNKNISKYLVPQYNNRLLGGYGGGDLTLFPPGIDTLSYSDWFYVFKSNYHPIDTSFIKSRYCYEQIVPLSMSEEKRSQKMLQDLNDYLEEHYHMTGNIENRSVTCYALVRISSIDKVRATNLAIKYDKKSYQEKGKAWTRYSAFPLNQVMDYTMESNLSLRYQLKENKMKGKPFMILNATGWDNEKLIDIVLPTSGLNTIDDLSKALKPYDLTITEKKVNLNFLVFKKIEDQPITKQ